MEAVFARGDRKLGEVLLKACEKGMRFDGWSDCFSLEKWMQAFSDCGIDMAFYTRARDYDEILPWDHLDYGISKKFLINENKKAHESLTTPHCRIQCAGCGSNKLNGGKCDALSKA